MPGRMQFDFSLKPRPAQRQGQGALRILVLGDFSARPTAERMPLAQRPTHRVDVDSLDKVMQRLAPRVKLPAGDVHFEGLDDFHPDPLFARLPVFASLRQMRQRLMDPARFAQAAAELLQEQCRALGRAEHEHGVDGWDVDAFVEQVDREHNPDSAVGEIAQGAFAFGPGCLG